MVSGNVRQSIHGAALHTKNGAEWVCTMVQNFVVLI